MPKIAEEIKASHTAPDAYEGGKENVALKDMRAQFTALIDSGIEEKDSAICQQILVFANQVGDYARRGKNQIEASRNENHPELIKARQLIVSAKEMLESGESANKEDKAQLIKELESVILEN